MIIIGGPGPRARPEALIGRMAALIRGGHPAQTICYLTFSSRSADDVRQQLAALPSTQEASRELFVGTVHHYASTFLRQAGANILNISPHFTIWDQDQATEILTELVRAELETIPDQDEDARAEVDMTQSEIGRFFQWHGLNRAVRAGENIPADKAFWYRLADLYTAEKRRQNTLDLDDLIPTAIRAMEENQQTQAIWSRMRSRHVMVDEFQDITPVQYRLLQLMTGPTRSVTIATDPNQSIYAFRGADSQIMEQFRLDHNDAGMHVLRLNHRSTKTLTDMATAITDHDSMPRPAPRLSASPEARGAAPHPPGLRGRERKHGRPRAGHDPGPLQRGASLGGHGHHLPPQGHRGPAHHQPDRAPDPLHRHG